MSGDSLGPTVVIDPGHGGEAVAGGSTPNRACGPGGALEKHLVLDLARRVQANLHGWGGRVRLTREGDHNPSLGQRAALARGCRAAAFVSLHLGEGRAGQGTLTAVHPQAGPESRALAERVHAALLQATGHPDLGIQALPLAVLDPAHHAPGTACVLVEAAALTDPEEERRLSRAGYRGAVAGAIGHGLRGWLRERGPPPPAVSPHLRFDLPGRRRAVVVGVGDYSALSDVPDCRMALRDAEAMARALAQRQGVAPQDLILLRDPSGEQLRAALARQIAASGAEDVLCLYFAGRGTLGPRGGPALVTADGDLLGRERMEQLLAGHPLSHLTVLADAGFALQPPSPGSRSLPHPGGPGYGGARGLDPGRVRWICAAGPGGEAYEHPGVGHGLFTSALLERTQAPGLQISHHGLITQLQEDVTELLLRCRVVGRQRPWAHLPGADTLLLSPPGSPAPAPLTPIRHHVPLVPQSSEMSCWAAAAAMVVGWRERLPMGDDELARVAGQMEAFQLGLLPRDVDHMARHWGLQAEPMEGRGVAELHALLRRHGPLWLGEADPDLHVVVVTGMRGDGTPDGTRVEIADPWPIGRGERYTLSFRELMDNLTSAAHLVGPHVQVMHAKGRGGTPLGERGAHQP